MAAAGVQPEENATATVTHPPRAQQQVDLAIEIYPNVDDSWIRRQFAIAPYLTVNELTEMIINWGAPPKLTAREKTLEEELAKKRAEAFLANNQHVESQPDLRNIMDTFPHFYNEPAVPYEEETFQRLAATFARLAIPQLRRVMALSGNRFAVSWALLLQAGRQQNPPFNPATLGPRGFVGNYRADVSWGGAHVFSIWFSVIRSKRSAAMTRRPPHSPTLAEHVQHITQAITSGKTGVKAPKESDDDKMNNLALDDNPDEDEGGDTFECPICYDEHPMKSVVLCVEEHMFCRNCVSKHANEYAYGQAQGTSAGGLACLELNCEGHFSDETLKAVLKTDLMRRLDEQRSEANIHAADIANFERCRYCRWGAIIEKGKEEDKVFSCLNEKCGSKLCRLCDRDWNDNHIGKRCEEVRKDLQEKSRLEFEEKMTEAVIRRCPSCKIEFDKIQGCNRMTCRCGHTMCYLCRTPNIAYNHFCAHPKDPSEKGCPHKCGKCMLWERADDRDSKALAEVQLAAANDERALNDTGKPIGDVDGKTK